MLNKITANTAETIIEIILWGIFLFNLLKYSILNPVPNSNKSTIKNSNTTRAMPVELELSIVFMPYLSVKSRVNAIEEIIQSAYEKVLILLNFQNKNEIREAIPIVIYR